MKRKVNIIISLWGLCTLLLLSSCQTTKVISIDYLKPAAVNFPEQLRKVGIVNNAMIDYTTQKSKAKWESQKALLLGDATLTAESLAEHLAEANYFDEVVIYDSAIQLQEDNYQNHPLTSQEIEDLTKFLQVDFLVAVENIILNAKKEDFLIGEGLIISQLQVEVRANIKAYMPSRSTPIFKDQITDTIYWDLNDPMNFYIKEKSLVDEASVFAGERLASRLVPQWNTAERLLYTNGNKVLKEADKLIKEYKWEEAFRLWNNLYNSADHDETKMKAGLNIAVYYEMMDNFEEAVRWVTIAQDMAYKVDGIQNMNPKLIYNSSNYLPIKNYANVLKERQENSFKLEQQMKRFEDENN